MIQETAHQGETLDMVLRRAHGQETAEALAATLALNPGLADLGAVLPLGTPVLLPDPPGPPPRVAVVKLWD